MESTARIYLTPLRDEHITRYMALSEDPELIETMGWEPFQPDERERFIAFTKVLSLPDLRGGTSIVFSIVTIAEKQAIGYVSIKGIDLQQSLGEIGIAIMEKDFRTHGYGTEALRQAAEYAFDIVGIDRLGLSVFPDNRRAIRAYEKLGFRKTTLLKNSWEFPDGTRADMALMELTPDRLA